jgi:hypothetical protein
LWRRAYRRDYLWLNPEINMNEARSRQRSLLYEDTYRPLPKEVEEQALELLVQMFLTVVARSEQGECDEQDHY